MKKLLVLAFLFILLAALDIASNSAPASSSGAPDERDCTTSGCHDSYPANSGSGSVSVSLENSGYTYQPGKTYTVSVRVEHASFLRYGFQLLALDGQNTNAGILTPISAYRNQVTKGYGTFSSRRYMTYTYESTLASTPGSAEWSFKWIAPDSPAGDIRFFVAGIAANNDGTDSGDYCYTTSLKLTDANDLPAGVFLDAWQLGPGGNLEVHYGLTQPTEIRLELINAEGKCSREILSSTQAAGKYTLNVALSEGLATGVYMLRLRAGNECVIKKIFLAR